MGSRGPRPGFVDKTCPVVGCPDRGALGRGNIVGNGTYRTQSGRVRKYVCRTCGRSFTDRTGTAFDDLRTPEPRVILALGMVARGLGVRSAAAAMGVLTGTVRGWVERAAAHAPEVEPLLLEAGVSRHELDALWASARGTAGRRRGRGRKGPREGAPSISPQIGLSSPDRDGA